MDRNETEFTGLLERLDIRVEESQWGTGIVLRPDGDRSKVTGTFVTTKQGDTVRVVGRWKSHERFGDQFAFTTIASERPADPAGVKAWLAARCPGVGPSTAQMMVSKWPGDELWDVMEKCPEDLTELPRINDDLAHAIHDAYMEYAGEVKHKPTLLGWGLTELQIRSALNGLGTEDLGELVEFVQQDPYGLIAIANGIGFLRADAIARTMGVDPSSQFRVAAAMHHICGEAKGSGHVFLWGGELVRRTRELLADASIPDDSARSALEYQCNRKPQALLVRETLHEGDKKRNRYYLTELYHAEENVLAAFERANGIAATLPAEPAANTNDSGPRPADKRSDKRVVAANDTTPAAAEDIQW